MRRLGIVLSVLMLVITIPLFLAACSSQGAPTAPTDTSSAPVATLTLVAEVPPTPVPTVEPKYDEAWARKQVEPFGGEMLEMTLAQEWNKLYDLLSDEDKAVCSRSAFVTEMATAWLPAAALGVNEIMKARLQDLKEGKLPITFSEISKDRITYAGIIGDVNSPDTIVREHGEWVAVQNLN